MTPYVSRFLDLACALAFLLLGMVLGSLLSDRSSRATSGEGFVEAPRVQSITLSVAGTSKECALLAELRTGIFHVKLTGEACAKLLEPPPSDEVVTR